jgi:heme-degrading monooxygenase HmoA
VIVVLFSTTHREGFPEAEYRETSARMHEIVEAMPGFISYKEYQAEDGEGVAVVRFESEEALREWGSHPEHRAAQRRGREAFYDDYWIQVCSTIREGRFQRGSEYRNELADFFRTPATMG